MTGPHDVRLIETATLSPTALLSIRRLMAAAFAGDFSDDDWAHALGGWHVVAGTEETIIAHASVVPRAIYVGGRGYRAGYLEAVAVAPLRRRTGLGTAVTVVASTLVREHFELGVLSTSAWHFYERLGWQRWQGPAFVREPRGRLRRVEDEDDGVMALRCGPTTALDVRQPIACDQRSGDSW